MKLCAIWPAVSLCQTKHPVTPSLALLTAEQRANISVYRIFREMFTIRNVVDYVCTQTLCYGQIHVTAAFLSYVVDIVNV